jgi:hypothetical protein
VHEPEGNGVVGRLIHPLKQNLLWVQDFAIIEKLRQVQIDLAHWY